MAQLDDFIDIIVNSEQYKEKLIFHNTKNKSNGKLYERILEKLKKRCSERGEELAFNVNQLRQKFKRCVAECKHAALTIKTATGIDSFIEKKGYGAWFNQLYALVKTRDSCNPDEAVEPSATSKRNGHCDPSKDLPGPSTEYEAESGATEDKEEPLYVPVKKRKRMTKHDTLSEAIQIMREVVDNDPTKDLVKLIREDMERSREHEMKLMQMMLAAGNHQPPMAEQNPVTTNMQHGHYAQSSLSGGYHQPYPPNMAPGQHYFTQDFPMQQEQQGFQFHPISPSQMSRPASITSNHSGSSASPLQSDRNDSPVYHSF